MRQSRQENSSTRIQSVIRSLLHRRRFCRHLERKRDARARETEQLKRLAERSPRSWQRARTPDGKTYYYDELRQADMLIRGHLNTIGEEMSEI